MGACVASQDFIKSILSAVALEMKHFVVQLRLPLSSGNLLKEADV